MTAAQSIVEPWTVTRLASSLGAEVRGIDLSTTTAEDIDKIKSLLDEHMVLFFPGQNLTVEQHVAFGRHFGKLEGHPNLKNAYMEHPEIFELAASKGGVADEWHTDITFEDSPALMSILRMVKCPEVGGDTMWTNLCEAYEHLSDPMKDMLDGLTALHDALPHARPDKMAIHPVVRINPVNGRKALYVNEHFTRRIVELNATESEVLLNYLTKWVQNSRFTVRYHWTEGTIGMWDNRATQHHVLNDFNEERIIQRVTIMGDKPVGVKEPPYEPWTRQNLLSATSRLDRQ
ncbi:MAG: TauD/TfdA family dioxygenase, partial [Pseudomonadota bacterium]